MREGDVRDSQLNDRQLMNSMGRDAVPKEYCTVNPNFMDPSTVQRKAAMHLLARKINGTPRSTQSIL